MMNRSEIAHKIKKYEFKLNNANTYDQFKYYNNKLNTYKKFIGGGGFENLPADPVVHAYTYVNNADTLTIRKLIKMKRYLPLQEFAHDDPDNYFPGLNAAFQRILPGYSDPMTIDSFLEGIKDAINMYLCIKKESDNTRRTPSNWCGIDTPLEEFTPLPQWECLRFNGKYELVEILDHFKTDATVFDTSGIRFSKLTRIDSYFLSSCRHLTNVDLSGLSAVTRIGDHFLSNCSNLTNVDLSVLTAVIQIGNYFLTRCNNLTSVNLSGLTAVMRIGYSFLSSCRGLTNVDLSWLTAVAQIGDYFLFNCKNLTDIDLSGLAAVTQIGDYFLEGCENLNKIIGMPNVTSVGDDFLANCKSLSTITGFSQLRSVSRRFLSECPNLKEIPDSFHVLMSKK